MMLKFCQTIPSAVQEVPLLSMTPNLQHINTPIPAVKRIRPVQVSHRISFRSVLLIFYHLRLCRSSSIFIFLL